MPRTDNIKIRFSNCSFTPELLEKANEAILFFIDKFPNRATGVNNGFAYFISQDTPSSGTLFYCYYTKYQVVCKVSKEIGFYSSLYIV